MARSVVRWARRLKAQAGCVQLLIPASASHADHTVIWVYFGTVAYAMSVPTDKTSATGLRVSELLALKWQDICFDAGEIQPRRAIVAGHVGELKTAASGMAVPMAIELASALLDWRRRCPYNQDADNVFGSPDLNSQKPISQRIFELAKEDWAIWKKWEAAFHSGKATVELYPALLQDRRRHEELRAILNSALTTNAAICVTQRGSFERLGSGEYPKGVHCRLDGPRRGSW